MKIYSISKFHIALKSRLERIVWYFFPSIKLVANYKWGRYFIWKDYIGSHIFQGTYETVEAKYFYLRYKSGKNVILDIGANLGFYTILFSSNHQNKVYAFEPSTREFKRLERNVLFNKRKNTNIFRLAVGAENSLKILHLGKNNHGINSLKYSGVEYLEKEKVSVIRLDEFTELDSIKRLDLIKVDVEGYENAVLHGAQALIEKYHPDILIEEWKIYSKEISNYKESDSLTLLKKLGYNFYHLVDNKPELIKGRLVSKNILAIHISN